MTPDPADLIADEFGLPHENVEERAAAAVALRDPAYLTAQAAYRAACEEAHDAGADYYRRGGDGRLALWHAAMHRETTALHARNAAEGAAYQRALNGPASNAPHLRAA